MKMPETLEPLLKKPETLPLPVLKKPELVTMLSVVLPKPGAGGISNSKSFWLEMWMGGM